MQHQAIETPAAEPAAVGFTVDRDALHGALQLLKRVTERRNTIPVLSTLLFAPAAEGSGVEMTATDLDLQLSLTLPCQWQGKASFCIGAYDVADVIKKLPKGGDVEFSKRDGKMTVRSDRTVNRLALDARHAEDFPQLKAKREDEPKLPGFTVPAPHLVADLEAVAWAQGKEEVRYYLVGTAMQRAADSLVLVATNGSNLAYIERPAPEGSEALPDVILPAKGCDIVRRALKGRDDIVAVAASESRFVVAGEGLRVIGKTIDGTFPNWRKVLPAEGEELQLIAMPEAEPRMPLPSVEMAAKAIGAAPAVEMMADRVRLTSPARPEFTAICMLLKEAALPKGFAYEMPGHAAALDYLTDLATAAGLPLFHSEWEDSQGEVHRTEERRLQCENGLVMGATFGARVYYEDVEELDYSTFTVRTGRREVKEERYEPGAYSVAMPRIRQGMAAAVTIGEPGVDERAVATKNGAVMLSAEQIAALAGDPADWERVDIPEKVYWHGRALEPGWRLPEPLGTVEKSGKRSKRRKLSDREVLQAYTADAAGTVAALQPVPTVEATVIAETVAGLAMALSGNIPAVEMTADLDPEPVEAAPAPAVPNEPEAPKRRRGTAGRAKRALAMLCGYQRGLGTRAYDNCFEMFDGAAVVADMLAAIEADDGSIARRIVNGWVRHPEGGEVAARNYCPLEVLAACLDKLDIPTPAMNYGCSEKVDSYRKNKPEPAPAVPNEPEAAETPVERDSEVPALPSQPDEPENASGEALAKPEAVPDVEPDPVSVQIAALEARIARLEAERNGSGTQPESKSGAEPAADTPAVKMQKPAFERDRRLRMVRAYLRLRRQREQRRRVATRLVGMRQRLRSANSAVAALVEGGVKARDNWQAASEREAKVKRMLNLARFRTRDLIEALREARAKAESGGKHAGRAEDAEFRAADLAKQVEDLQARLAEETARADSADIRFDAERDKLQARIVDLENEKIERLSGGRIKLPGYAAMKVAETAAPWPMQNGRMQ